MEEWERNYIIWKVEKMAFDILSNLLDGHMSSGAAMYGNGRIVQNVALQAEKQRRVLSDIKPVDDEQFTESLLLDAESPSTENLEARR